MMTIDNATLALVHGGNLLHGAGEAVGFGAGVAVTGALVAVPGWNAQVPGKPAGFEKRHESVVGPQIAGYADKLHAGPLRDFVSGVGAGATAAPPWSFAHGI
jgi:hypothetical protein